MTAYRGTALAALADPTRRVIFERVAERPSAVVDLASELPVSRPAVSQHLKVLKDAGLVSARAEGNRRIYQADPEGLAELRGYLEQFWSKALDSSRRLSSNNPARSTHEHPGRRTAIQLSIVVEAPLERAFHVFIDDFDRIKPREHNMLAVDIEETVSSRAPAGASTIGASTAASASGRAYWRSSRPTGVVFSWDISPRWQIETDLDRTSEVEVRFIAETAGPHARRARASQPRSPRPRLGERAATASARDQGGRCTCSATPMWSPETADGADQLRD